MDARKNIVLTGMPAAGKSTLGVLLAKAMKMPFIDTDLVIQQREDRLLQEIINTEGIAAFLEKEEKAILSLKLEGHVIATGGSVIYSRPAMEHLRTNSIIVYLKLSFGEIEKRISNITTRGIAISPGKTLEDVYRERTPLYEAYADLVIDCSGKDMECIVEEIIKNKNFSLDV